MKEMLRTIFPAILWLAWAGLQAQDRKPAEGIVSFITSQSVYVKFASTAAIVPGDTLFLQKDQRLIPALVVRERSSTSCVCAVITTEKISESDKIFHQGRSRVITSETEVLPAPAVDRDTSGVFTASVIDTTIAPANQRKLEKQQIHGYFSVASYSNFSDESSGNSQRMKYTLSFLGKNLFQTNLSAECYINFIHSNVQWEEIQKDVFNGLKIYSLALNYDFGKKASLLLGRKINPKLSNMGPNDGIQFEYRLRQVAFGLIAGFRPDYENFGFNAKLFQTGVYVYHEMAGKHGNMQSTLAFVEQTNEWKTDRRYLYLQHVNSLIKKLTFFGSAEIDLFRKVFNAGDSTYVPENNLHLTNLYLSLNYRVIRQLTISFSYSARENVVYYETYKNFLDRLIDPEKLQGYLLQVVVRPVNKLSIGLTGAYRFQKADPRPARNIYGYITYSEIPGIRISPTFSVTVLETSYLSGNIYSLGISRDFFKGRLYLGATYRYVDYRYLPVESAILQNMAEASLTWRIWKRFFCSVYYEGTFQQSLQFNRIYAQLNLGF